MCFVDADSLLLRINHEDRIRDAGHRLDAAEVLLELLLLLLQSGDLLLGKDIKCAILRHRVDLVQTLNPALDRLEVRQHAAEPSLVHIIHTAALSLGLDGILCLLLRADKQNRAALLDDLEDRLVGLIDLDHRLLQINDVNPVSLRENVRSHLGIPSSRLMAEMDTCFQQLLHRYYTHFVSSILLVSTSASCSADSGAAAPLEGPICHLPSGKHRQLRRMRAF